MGPLEGTAIYLTGASRGIGKALALRLARDGARLAITGRDRAALEAVARGGAEALPEQASLVLSTLAGWRGERADQVKRSLRGFLEASAPPPR